MVIGAILRMNGVLARNYLFSLRRHSRFKLGVVGVVGALLFAGTFLGLYWGFRWVEGFGGVGPMLVNRMLYVFFFAWFLMLILSNAVIGYVVLYRQEEIDHLLGMPLDHGSHYLYGLFKTLVLSSWAPLLMALPFFLAYGLARSASWYFYLAIPVFIFPFFILLTAWGQMLALLLGVVMPRRGVRWTAIILFLVFFVGLVFWLRRPFISETGTAEIGILIHRILQQTNFSLVPLVPSYWFTQGVLFSWRGIFSGAGFYFLLLLSSCLFFLELGYRLYRRFYVRCLSFVRSHPQREVAAREGGVISESIFSFLPRPYASLLSKDTRLFFRDPSQWVQCSVFFGILAVYILNLRSGFFAIEELFWKYLIYFLNLSSCLCIVAMLSVRFVYPLISLEGKKVWLLGLSRVGFRRLLCEKFLSSFLGLLLVSESVMILSSVMLKVPLLIAGLSCSTILFSCLALCGMAIGLGAVFPDFKAETPIQVASGFGSALAFILGLLYCLAVLVLLAGPVFGFFFKKAISQEGFWFWLGVDFVLIVTLSLVAVFFSLRSGTRALERMEF